MTSCFVLGLIAGPLVQTYGARRVATIGTFIVCFGLMMSSFAQHVWMLYVFYGICCGKISNSFKC